jgi:hypothetical protein
MRIWIDDMRKMPKGYDVHVHNYKEAKKLIDADCYTDDYIEHISFDHDLGEDKTGYDIARLIEKYAFKGLIPRMTWEVHSMNPVGASNITKAMKNAERYWDKNDSI